MMALSRVDKQAEVCKKAAIAGRAAGARRAEQSAEAPERSARTAAVERWLI
jgi:hypothetical protein